MSSLSRGVLSAQLNPLITLGLHQNISVEAQLTHSLSALFMPSHDRVVKESIHILVYCTLLHFQRRTSLFITPAFYHNNNHGIIDINISMRTLSKYLNVSPPWRRRRNIIEGGEYDVGTGLGYLLTLIRNGNDTFVGT